MDIENAYSTHEISCLIDDSSLARSRHGLGRYATQLFTTQIFCYTLSFGLPFSNPRIKRLPFLLFINS